MQKKAFFWKKRITAVLFLIMLYAFSAADIYYYGKTIVDAVIPYTKLRTLSDLKVLISVIDADVEVNLLWRNELIEIYGYVQKLLYKSEIANFDIVIDDNGFLNYSAFYHDPDQLVNEYARRVMRLRNNVASKGTKVFFLTTPSKYSLADSAYDKGFPVSDPNPTQDEMLLYLDQYSVPYFDMREWFREEQFPYSQTFFRTDHHWTTRGAFEGFRGLVYYMNKTFDAGLDPSGKYTNIDNYTSIMYPQSLQGSMGRRTGDVLAGLDDFELLLPKFDENTYTVSGAKVSGETIGYFEEALLFSEFLEPKAENVQLINNTYLRGVRAWDKITNNTNKEGPRVLAIRDSYFTPVAAFLAPLCSQLDMIWPLTDSEKVDIMEHLKANTYDYIIIEAYPYNIDIEMFPYFWTDDDEDDEQTAISGAEVSSETDAVSEATEGGE